MNIIFFGNTKYSVIDAKALHNHFGLCAVVTIPDKKIKENIIQSPIKSYATENNIPVIETDKLTSASIEQLRQLHPDFLVVADYGLILPQTLLQIPKFAPLNIHHSLLPKYRGPAPVPAMLLHGDPKTGVTIIIMNDKVDDGDIMSQKEYILQPNDTAASVLTKLNELGSQAVIEVIEHFNEIIPIQQEVSKATFTKYMEKQDGYIDISNPPVPEITDRMIRAYYPWPGVWTRIRLGKGDQSKDKILKFLPDNKLQVEGKKPQTLKDFLNGYPEVKQLLEKLLQQ